MEAHFTLKSGNLNEYLSVQQLVDCDTKEKGCKGGWPSIAYNYIQKNGVVSDANYPYKASTNTCEDDTVSSSEKYKISKFASCEEEECNQNNFYNNLLQKGPFAVVIDAYNTEFFNYKSGIYNQSCAEPNHAIILVGYGIDKSSGEDYWIIRNSWNKSWGMNGYGYVKNDAANYYSCNINRYGFQPEVIA
jgi:cathepsin L